MGEMSTLSTAEGGVFFLLVFVFSVVYMDEKKRQGEVIVPPDVNVWPHEIRTAQALAAYGYTVRFIRKSEEEFHVSADAYINGVAWEMKAPTSSHLHKVEDNLRRAVHQSQYVVFDSRRMKKIPDIAIERELRKWAKEMKELKGLLFVNRLGQVLPIK